ncbi:TolC family protein [Borrelia sp. HM]|uniref:TolC family protein n=1 Tax=Borrelia sp. HM TaxID=1882662 RepID=UPI001C8175DC|nr:TolC family protein [Borrelia sp. HM]
MQISVENAVRMALNNGLDIKNAEYEEKIKKLHRDTAWNIFIPNLNISTSFSGPQFFMSNLVSSSPWQLGFGISANFLISASDFSKIKLAILNYEAFKLNREKVIQNIKLTVLKTYNKLIAFKNIFEVLKSQLENSRIKFEQASIAYKNGIISEIDYLDAKLKYSKSQPDLDQHIIEFEGIKEKFKLLLGLDVAQDFETIGELSDEILDVSLFDKIVNFNESLDLKKLNGSAQIMKAMLHSIWLDTFLPKFSFSVSYSPGGVSFSNGFSNFSNQGFQVSLGLTYSLSETLPFSKSFAGIWEQDYRLHILDNQIKNKIREFKSNIIQKRKSVRLYKSILDNSKINLEISKKNYQMAFKAFNKGTLELVKLNDIETSYKQSDLQFIKDKLNYANIILEYKELIGELDS